MLSMYGLKMRQMNDLRSGDQSEMKVNKSCRYKWCCMVFTVYGHWAQGTRCPRKQQRQHVVILYKGAITGSRCYPKYSS